MEADYHLPLLPGTNVAVINAMAHVVVTEGLVDEEFVRRALRPRARSSAGAEFIAEERNSPEAVEALTGVPAAMCAAPRGSTPPAATRPSTTGWA